MLDLQLSSHWSEAASKTEKIGNWELSTSQNVDEDRNYYSKAWHRCHGPKRTISDRTLTIKNLSWKKKILTFPLKSFAGDFVARSVCEAGLEPKKSKGSMKIRLHRAYDAIFLESKRGYKFFSRTLLGSHYDYVIVSPLGMTYHSESREFLISGLHNKIRKQSRKLNGKIDFELCKKLGFCESGIREFCEIFNFSLKGKYFPSDIEAAVRNDPSNAGAFMRELKILSSALNYRVVDFS